MKYFTACTRCHKTFESDSFNSGNLCPEHKREQQEERRARDRKRFADDEYRKFLNSPAWRKLSALLRRQNPMCQCVGCTNKADAVHHILSGRDNPALRLDPANLVAICDRCHNNADGDMGKYTYVPTKLTVLGVETEYPHARAAEASNPENGLAAEYGPPESLPVEPQHCLLPDGTIGHKDQWNRDYRKQGGRWMLIPAA